MSKDNTETYPVEGATVDTATLRLIAAGAFPGRVTLAAIPRRRRAEEDHRFVYTDIDAAVDAFLAAEQHYK